MAPIELALDVARDAIPEALVLGLDLAIGGQDLGQAVLGEPRPPLEVLGLACLRRHLQRRLSGCFRTCRVVLFPVGVVDGILAQGAPPGKSCAL